MSKHICRDCGVETEQPDSECYKAPSTVEECLEDWGFVEWTPGKYTMPMKAKNPLDAFNHRAEIYGQVLVIDDVRFPNLTPATFSAVMSALNIPKKEGGGK